MNNITYVILACYIDKGMKSYGSKGLMIFNNKRLLDYQIESIKKSQSKKNNYEIIILCDFDQQKISKIYSSDIKVYGLDNKNPIHRGAELASHNKILFIDYGCIFDHSIIKNIGSETNSLILCIKNIKNTKLDIGCITDKDQKLQHMFFDLPENKFTNIFLINNTDKRTICNNIEYHNKNLLYFEIINFLKQNGSIIEIRNIPNTKFSYFNNIRQKNAISKFIKNINS